MVDLVDSKTRSLWMSNIKSADTEPELIVRRVLHGLNLRYRLGAKIGKIKPDVVLRKKRIAVFVHGCYWHKHKGCKLAYADRTYTEFWISKFKKNIERDKNVQQILISQGWRICIVWECTTRNSKELTKLANAIKNWMESDESVFETEYKLIDKECNSTN